jgi:beta-lactamase class C
MCVKSDGKSILVTMSMYLRHMKKSLWLILLGSISLLTSCTHVRVDQKRVVQKIAQEYRTQKIKQFVLNYQRIFDQELKESGCPGAAVGIVVDSSFVWEHSYGTKEVGKKDLINEHTLFRLGSLSKGITGLLVSKLVAEGKLNWDDKVCSEIAGFTMSDTNQAKRISVRHLLSHSTGLPRHTFTNMIEDGLEPVAIVNRLQDVPLIGKEGDTFAYQNFTFALIEKILQNKTSLAFSELLRNEILGPASMLDANSSLEEFLASGNYAMPHRPGDSAYLETALNGKYYNAISAGGINASIADMTKWLQVLLGMRSDVANASMLEAIFQPVVASSAEHRFRSWHGLKKSYYGMGWRIMELPDRNIFYHGGSVNDYRTEIAIDPVSKIGICVLFNGHNNIANKIIPEFLELVRGVIPEV